MSLDDLASLLEICTFIPSGVLLLGGRRKDGLSFKWVFQMKASIKYSLFVLSV